MGRRNILGAMAGAILIAAACTSSATTAPSAATESASSPPIVTGGGSSSESPAPSGSPSVAPSDSSAPSASIASVDPCALFTPDDAKTLTGVAFGPGKSTLLGKIPACLYRSGSASGPVDSLTVGVLVTSLSAAEAAYQAATIKADADAHGIPLVKVDGVGDEAVRITAAAGPLSINAIYVRRGSTFIALDDESNRKAASNAAMKDAAEHLLGELP